LFILGIETRFGLAFPKYKLSNSEQTSNAAPQLTALLGVANSK